MQEKERWKVGYREEATEILLDIVCRGWDGGSNMFTSIAV
jgi:hypothetical protein